MHQSSSSLLSLSLLSSFVVYSIIIIIITAASQDSFILVGILERERERELCECILCDKCQFRAAIKCSHTTNQTVRHGFLIPFSSC